MPQPALRPPHRRPLAALALTVATAITLSACSLGDTGSQHRPANASPDTSATGAIDTTTAREVVDAYQAANNAANARQDLKGLARIEAGMAYAQDRADYQQWKTWSSKERARYSSGFRYEQRTYYIPEAGTATWFAMEATSSDTAKARGLFVFDRRGGRYKMVAAIYATSKMPIPKIAFDSHGLATAVDPAHKVGALAPQNVTAAVTDLYVTGGTKQGRQLTATPASKEAVRLHDNRNRGKKSSWRTASYFSAQPAHPQVYALRTADGGVLALAPGAYTIEYLHTRYLHGGLIIPGPQEAVYNASHRPVITDEYQGETLVALSPTGRAKLIARDLRLVDSR
ncbi:hypothetical protein ACWCQ1_47810 [Streptomyces sp. NPDC002144]